MALTATDWHDYWESKFIIFLNTTWLKTKAHLKPLSLGQPYPMLITAFQS